MSTPTAYDTHWLGLKAMHLVTMWCHCFGTPREESRSRRQPCTPTEAAFKTTRYASHPRCRPMIALPALAPPSWGAHVAGSSAPCAACPHRIRQSPWPPRARARRPWRGAPIPSRPACDPSFATLALGPSGAASPLTRARVRKAVTWSARSAVSCSAAAPSARTDAPSAAAELPRVSRRCASAAAAWADSRTNAVSIAAAPRGAFRPRRVRAWIPAKGVGAVGNGRPANEPRGLAGRACER
eukprot:scaffold29372_cov25-Tisochrysis_lutea.AAC.4